MRLPNRPIPLREVIALLPEELRYTYDVLRAWALEGKLRTTSRAPKGKGDRYSAFFACPRSLAFELRALREGYRPVQPKTLRALNPRFRKIAEEQARKGEAV